ncbi:Ig-like domain-containing protein [Microbacterium sp. 3J1]|uniref:Ig-like domain-containing protein n=1 Tax=Microbacterium sp. 3J1 TaxID=861269 RepID=UPI000AAA74A9|nr:hypothetical protein [Microbacterium sp. 3J1]
MSTDDERPEVPAVPRTRAEMRAAREAAEREAATAEVRAAPAAPELVQPAAAEASAPEPVPPAAAEVPDTAPPITKPAFVPAPAPAPKAPRNRRFLLALGAVLGILVLVGAGLGAVSLTQGPRITEVQVDPAEAIETSGSRVILTANQSLAAIDESQVTVEPSAPFTLDAAGRGIGIRFTVPLDDDTKYTVSVADAVGAGGGPSATLTTSFTTPASNIFLLRRDVDKKDTIFRTDLTGESAVPVFAAGKINDFRATSSQLVVSVEEDEGSKLIVMRRDGTDQRELELPGEGYVGAIQVSDRGGLVGYSYSDKELSDTEGRASVLVTQSLTGDDDPVITEVGGEEANIFVWQFVPDSAAVLFIDFDGALSLVDRSSDAGVQSLGLATTIQGVSRGTYTAIVERLDGTVVELDLTDGSEQPLAASDPDYGTATTITPFPGGTLRHVVARSESGIPSGQAIVKVNDKGAATPLVEVGPTDSILQACASPSGQYAAVVIAPDLADNPYDQMLLPLPENMETHLVDLRSGDELVALTGFDASWCQTAPQF